MLVNNTLQNSHFFSLLSSPYVISQSGCKIIAGPTILGPSEEDSNLGLASICLSLVSIVPH